MAGMESSTAVLNESQRLAAQMGLALAGGAWHGPSWRELLDGVTRKEAEQRPLPGAHNVLEIIQHSITWHDVARRRFLGENPQVPDALDWPDLHPEDDEAFRLLVRQLFETGDALRRTLESFPPERLLEARPGLTDTWFELAAGELQHMLYHAGQVAVLKKALAGKESGRA